MCSGDEGGLEGHTHTKQQLRRWRRRHKRLLQYICGDGGGVAVAAITLLKYHHHHHHPRATSSISFLFLTEHARSCEISLCTFPTGITTVSACVRARVCVAVMMFYFLVFFCLLSLFVLSFHFCLFHHFCCFLRQQIFVCSFFILSHFATRVCVDFTPGFKRRRQPFCASPA